MKILIAPNAFKGSLTAKEAADAIELGLHQSELPCSTRKIPIADGGDGSLPVIADHLKLKLLQATVSGPLGAPQQAQSGWSEIEKLAVIELAEASGIRLVSPSDLDPWKADTFGTGQLIRSALERGAEKIYLTLGGSATVDGGIGILKALDIEVLDAEGRSIPWPSIDNIEKARALDLKKAQALIGTARIFVLCDVHNPLLGEQGAAAVFGPQKGLRSQDLSKMEAKLTHLAKLIYNTRKTDVAKVVGGGAAGGVSATLHGLFGAELISGGDQIMTWGGFYEALADVDLVITGEGRIDNQTAFGKGPGLVAKAAKSAGKRVVGLSGSVEEKAVLYQNFDAVFSVINEPGTLDQVMGRTRINLHRVSLQLGNLLAQSFRK